MYCLLLMGQDAQSKRLYLQVQFNSNNLNSRSYFNLPISWAFFIFGFIPKAFKLYPDTLEEIDEMIHDEKARIECQYQSQPTGTLYNESFSYTLISKWCGHQAVSTNLYLSLRVYEFTRANYIFATTVLHV